MKGWGESQGGRGREREEERKKERREGERRGKREERKRKKRREKEGREGEGRERRLELVQRREPERGKSPLALIAEVGQVPSSFCRVKGDFITYTYTYICIYPSVHYFLITFVRRVFFFISTRN